MLGMLVLACADLNVLLATAEVAAAMSVEGLLGTNRPFAPDIVRIAPPSRPTGERCGDPFSARRVTDRCVAPLRRSPGAGCLLAEMHPPGHRGGTRCPDPRRSGGHERIAVCHRQSDGHEGRTHRIGRQFPRCAPCARRRLSCDRRRRRWLTRREAHEPNARPGPIGGATRVLDAPVRAVNSGLMIAHYTMAAMVAANRTLATPASPDSMSTSASQEDHVSMGWGAVRKLRTILDNLGRIIAVELLAATRALDFRSPLEPGRGTSAVRELVRQHVPAADGDRFVAVNLAVAEELVRTGVVLAAGESVVGRWTT